MRGRFMVDASNFLCELWEWLLKKAVLRRKAVCNCRDVDMRGKYRWRCLASKFWTVTRNADHHFTNDESIQSTLIAYYSLFCNSTFTTSDA